MAEEEMCCRGEERCVAWLRKDCVAREIVMKCCVCGKLELMDLADWGTGL